MKKVSQFFASVILSLLIGLVLVGCTEDASTTTTTQGAEVTTTPEVTETSYYVAGNFSGYVANDPDFLMTEIANKPGWYKATVELTAAVRDNAYDGHYYKVTNGTWDAAGCFGAANYALQPAPASPTGGGLGSVWVYENQTLTVVFDSNTNTVYDNSMIDVLDAPIIYGDFSATPWAITAAGGALVLTQSATDTNLFTGSVTLPAYTGSGKGWSFAVALSEQYNTDYYFWGVLNQYLFSGNAGGFGQVSYINVTAATEITFTYNATTHQTAVTGADVVEVLPTPILYGTFTRKTNDNECYQILGDKAVRFAAIPEKAGKYSVSVDLAPFAAPTEGYYMTDTAYRMLVVTEIQYYAAWGVWGAKTQYDLLGEATGTASLVNVPKSGTYVFEFDGTTHATVLTLPFEAPVAYGTFTRLTNDSECYDLFSEHAVVMTAVSGQTGKYAVEFALNAFTAPTEGYYMADTGYRFLIVTDAVYYAAWGVWGAGTQYDLLGSATTTATVVTVPYTGTYRLVYDEATHVTTLTQLLDKPVVYGTFTRVSDDAECFILFGNNAVTLSAVSGQAGMYEVLIHLNPFVAPTTGYYTADAGYRFIVVTDAVYYTAWNVWGAGTQYGLSGNLNGTSLVNITATADVTLTFNSATHVTTVVGTGVSATEKLSSPVIYGDFSATLWTLNPSLGAIKLIQSATDANLYVATVTIPAYTGTGSGYAFDVCLGMTSYGAYGWGAGEQYLFSGVAAGFGTSSHINTTAATEVTFSYNATTHVTTVTGAVVID